MILFYALLLLLLGVARLILRRRVAALERKYMKVARATDQLFKTQASRPGNGGRPDPYAAARQAYLLGRAVERRESVEARYCAWQKLAERFGRFVTAVRGWRGRKLPYLIGVFDVLLVLGTFDYLGYHEQWNAQAFVSFVNTLLSKQA
jgi:hypothetical protein